MESFLPASEAPEGAHAEIGARALRSPALSGHSGPGDTSSQHVATPRLTLPLPMHAIALFSEKVPFANDMPYAVMIGIVVIGIIAFVAVAGVGPSEFASLALMLGVLLIGFIGSCAIIVAFRDGFN